MRIAFTVLAILLLSPTAHAQEGQSVAEAEVEPDVDAEMSWQATTAWASVGVVVASLAVIAGTQFRVGEIESSSAWSEARAAYPASVDNICAMPDRVEGLSGMCSEGSALEAASLAALTVNVLAFATALTFFLLDAEESEVNVAFSVSPERAELTMSGRF